MLSTVVLSNENQTCRGWEAPTSIGGGGCHYALLLPFHDNMAHHLNIFPSLYPIFLPHFSLSTYKKNGDHHKLDIFYVD